ncbi:uncharacterized protein LOC120258423 [Dioscorea cayenensis subsp. rotundata]|uniref:Uncharacterized protein LOC120258423 n=1 Tax=Dioscorea cayennensis subsp. rotundata TaxID=55577 RepID=A0AB40B574_DIOCR|nr:uncharacterized protein LOC120258423 [Dioscorea cayenensis subsp. rotundata]
MCLYHLRLSAQSINDITTTPASPDSLLIAFAGPSGFSLVDAICHVARSVRARVVLITARPESESEACWYTDAIAYLPVRMMDDDEEEGESGAPTAVRLLMGSLYEVALFVLFEMLVLRLGELLDQSLAQLRALHTNLD